MSSPQPPSIRNSSLKQQSPRSSRALTQKGTEKSSNLIKNMMKQSIMNTQEGQERFAYMNTVNRSFHSTVKREDVVKLENQIHLKLAEVHRKYKDLQSDNLTRSLEQIKVLDLSIEQVVKMVEVHCIDKASLVGKIWKSSADLYSTVYEEMSKSIHDLNFRLMEKTMHANKLEELVERLSALKNTADLANNPAGGSAYFSTTAATGDHFDLTLHRRLEEELILKNQEMLEMSELVANMSIWFPNFSKYAGSVLSKCLPPVESPPDSDDSDDENKAGDAGEASPSHEDMKSHAQRIAQNYLLKDLTRLQQVGVGFQVLTVEEVEAQKAAYAAVTRNVYVPRQESEAPVQVDVRVMDFVKLQGKRVTTFGTALMTPKGLRESFASRLGSVDENNTGPSLKSIADEVATHVAMSMSSSEGELGLGSPKRREEGKPEDLLEALDSVDYKKKYRELLIMAQELETNMSSMKVQMRKDGAAHKQELAQLQQQLRELAARLESSHRSAHEMAQRVPDQVFPRYIPRTRVPPSSSVSVGVMGITADSQVERRDSWILDQDTSEDKLSPSVQEVESYSRLLVGESTAEADNLATKPIINDFSTSKSLTVHFQLPTSSHPGSTQPVDSTAGSSFRQTSIVHEETSAALDLSCPEIETVVLRLTRTFCQNPRGSLSSGLPPPALVDAGKEGPILPLLQSTLGISAEEMWTLDGLQNLWSGQQVPFFLPNTPNFSSSSTVSIPTTGLFASHLHQLMSSRLRSSARATSRIEQIVRSVKYHYANLSLSTEDKQLLAMVESREENPKAWLFAEESFEDTLARKQLLMERVRHSHEWKYFIVCMMELFGFNTQRFSVEPPEFTSYSTLIVDSFHSRKSFPSNHEHHFMFSLHSSPLQAELSQKIFLDTFCNCFKSLKNYVSRANSDGRAFFPVHRTARVLKRVFRVVPYSRSRTIPTPSTEDLSSPPGHLDPDMDEAHMTWWRQLTPGLFEGLKRAVEMLAVPVESGHSDPPGQVDCYGCTLLCFSAVKQQHTVLMFLLADLYQFLVSLVPLGPSSRTFHLLLAFCLQRHSNQDSPTSKPTDKGTSTSAAPSPSPSIRGSIDFSIDDPLASPILSSVLGIPDSLPGRAGPLAVVDLALQRELCDLQEKGDLDGASFADAVLRAQPAFLLHTFGHLLSGNQHDTKESESMKVDLGRVRTNLSKRGRSLVRDLWKLISLARDMRDQEDKQEEIAAFYDDQGLGTATKEGAVVPAEGTAKDSTRSLKKLESVVRKVRNAVKATKHLPINNKQGSLQIEVDKLDQNSRESMKEASPSTAFQNSSFKHSVLFNQLLYPDEVPISLPSIDKFDVSGSAQPASDANIEPVDDVSKMLELLQTTEGLSAGAGSDFSGLDTKNCSSFIQRLVLHARLCCDRSLVRVMTPPLSSLTFVVLALQYTVTALHRLQAQSSRVKSVLHRQSLHSHRRFTLEGDHFLCSLLLRSDGDGDDLTDLGVMRPNDRYFRTGFYQKGPSKQAGGNRRKWGISEWDCSNWDRFLELEIHYLIQLQRKVFRAWSSVVEDK